MKSLLLQDGDLQFDGSGNLKTIDGQDEKRQSLKMLLSTNKGEWFLDLDLGFDYRTTWTKNPDFEEIRGELLETLDQHDEVESVEEINFKLDNVNRELTIYLTVELTDGEVIDTEVTV